MGWTIRVLAAAVLAASAHQLAHADTFYELGRVDGEVHALDAAVSDAGAGLKTATYYHVTGSHVANQFVSEVDCAAKRVRRISQKVMRSDLSPLRDMAVNSDWQKPDARTIGGILVNAVCALPAAPARLKRADAGSTADYLRQTSNEVLAALDSSKRFVILERTVGACILAKMPRKVSEDAMLAIQRGKPPMTAPGFNEQVNKLGAACSGRPVSTNDSLVIGAAISIFQRYGVMSLLADGGKIGEDHLAAAWHTAPADVRAPLLARAAMMHDPNVTVSAIESADPEPARRSTEALMTSPVLKPRLDALDKWSAAEKQLLVSQYFSGLAMGEVAEAQLRPVL